MRLSVSINDETLQDLISIESGLYAPLQGFMTQTDYNRVIDEMLLCDGSVWPLPITLDVDENIFLQADCQDKLYLVFEGKEIGYMVVEDCFRIDELYDVAKIYNTTSLEHPGVRKELSRSVCRIGGRTYVNDSSIMARALYPENIKNIFAAKGWKTVVGFQTRNPVHTAHEYLQRLALEIGDGLFINPSVGWKKEGDFTEAAVMAAYEKMVDAFYPQERVYVEGLRVYFRYAGPREALYHALLRRNLGCTHFIIGRDHAGVGGFYGTYEAHTVAREMSATHDIGITLLLMREPYFCRACGAIVTDNHCKHSEDNDQMIPISGTAIRKMLGNSELPEPYLMRPEIAQVLLQLGKENLFVKNSRECTAL